jgi:hypothetical protein
MKNNEGKLTPDARPPHGVEHRYAPLAIISFDGSGNATIHEDLRRVIRQAVTP